MDPARPDAPLGRGVLVTQLWNGQLILRKNQTKPLIAVLFGPRGIGKTVVLEELALRSRNQAAQPHSSVLDLAEFGDQPGWHALADLAFELAEPRWPQFGRLTFPRLTLGTMVVGGHIADDSPAAAHEAILDLLRGSPSPGQHAGAELVRLLPQLLGLPTLLETLPDAARWLFGLRPLVKRTYKTGMDFYSTALRTAPDSGLTALRRLGRIAPPEVDQVLAEAFLADLRAKYSSGFRPRKCLLLLDNAHAPTGRRLLAALAHAGREEPAPLVVVATSGRLDLALPGLPATDAVSFWTRMPTDRALPDSGGPVVRPVRLTPLTADEVDRLAADRFGRGGRGLAEFAMAVTGGHPWAVDRVLAACAQLGTKPTESDLRGLLDTKVGAEPHPLGETAARYLLLDDLPATTDVTAIVLARDLGAAESALPAAGLQLDLAPQCWIEPRSDNTGTRMVLPDWLRRLLRSACAPSTSDWTATLRALSDHAQHLSLPRVEVLHYEMADGRPEIAIVHLNRRFDEVDADTWIAEFHVVTAAPFPGRGDRDAWAEHAALVAHLRGRVGLDGLPTGDPHGERLITVTAMAVAAWIGADPLRDPTHTLTAVLVQGFHDLGRRSPGGMLRFAAEASRYPR